MVDPAWVGTSLLGICAAASGAALKLVWDTGQRTAVTRDLLERYREDHKEDHKESSEVHRQALEGFAKRQDMMLVKLGIMEETRVTKADHKDAIYRVMASQDAFSTRLGAFGTRVESLEQGQQELRAGQEAQAKRLAALEQGQQELRAGLQELRAGQEAQAKRLAALEQGQKEIVSRLDSMEANQSAQQSMLAEILEHLRAPEVRRA